MFALVARGIRTGAQGHGTIRPMSQKTLLLVDGSSYLYRAYHAMPDLRAVPGDPSSAATGAIRGMVNMMTSLRKEIPADYAVCVFDAKGPTFRDAWYPAYKANRAPMADDLRSQIDPIHEVVRLMGWPVVAVPGVEADDVIGTLAVMAAAQGIEVIVSSGDKDLSQLVNEHITIIDTMSGKRRDVAGVTAEFGVPPSKMVDYQTLVGDAVDNVPGVAKVGPKTAAKWLEEYGSLDALIERASEIKGVAGQNLRDALDWLPQGRRLVTIRTDCDLADHVQGLPAMDSIAYSDQDTGALKDFYEKYGFKGLARSVDAAAPVAPVEKAAKAARPTSNEPGLFDDPEDLLADEAARIESASALAYDTVLTWEAFDAWLARIKAADLVALDTETTSLNEMVAEIVGISFSVEPGAAAYIPLAHDYPDAPAQLPRDEHKLTWLLACLRGIVANDAGGDAAEMLERIFSKRYLGHSKLFEQQVRTRLVGILRRYATLPDLDEEDLLLLETGLVRATGELLMRGPLQIRVKEKLADITPFAYGVALGSETLSELEIAGCQASRLVSVENKATFRELVRAGLDESVLLVCIGGFAGSAKRRLLQKLAEYLGQSFAYLHWGDLDYGGLQIFQHLRQTCLPQVRPALMDADTYREFVSSGESFDDSYRRKLERLREQDGFGEFHDLLDAMLLQGKTLEQEAAPVERLANCWPMKK